MTRLTWVYVAVGPGTRIVCVTATRTVEVVSSVVIWVLQSVFSLIALLDAGQAETYVPLAVSVFVIGHMVV